MRTGAETDRPTLMHGRTFNNPPPLPFFFRCRIFLKKPFLLLFKYRANLSDQYFEDRQDRYVVIGDAAVAGFFMRLVESVMSFSMPLRKTGELGLPDKAPNFFKVCISFPRLIPRSVVCQKP